MTMVYATGENASTGGAVMLTFSGGSCETERYTATGSEGEGLDWYYLTYPIDADTSDEALRAVTGRMAAFIRQRRFERPVKVVIVAAAPAVSPASES